MNANTLNQYDAQFNTTAPFCNLEVVDLITDGLQVALLGQTRQQRLHAVVELLFAVKLDGKEKKMFHSSKQNHQQMGFNIRSFKQRPAKWLTGLMFVNRLTSQKTDSISEESKPFFSSFPIFSIEEHTCLSSVWFLVCLEAISPV